MTGGGAAAWLPPVPHLPGRTPRPPDEIFEPLKATLAQRGSPEEMAQSAAFAGGLSAFAHRYYWEAHELWEAVWIRLPPASAERYLMRGLIQLANAGLKGRMGRDAAAVRILDLADGALAEAAARASTPLMGLDADRLRALRTRAAAESDAIRVPRNNAL